MSEDTRKRKETDLMERQQNYEKKAYEAQTSLQQKEQELLQQIMLKVNTAVKEVAEGVTEVAGAAVDAVTDTASEVVEGAAEIVGEAAETVVDTAKEVVEGAGEVVEEAVEAVSETVEAAVEGVSNVVDSIKDAITGEDDDK